MKERAMNLLAHPTFPRIAEEQTVKAMGALSKLEELAKRQSPRMAIKVNGKILFINPGEVVAVQADGNYVSLQWDAGSHLLRESISVVAAKLEPYGFIRIHRSKFVNTSCVQEIRPYSTGEYGLRVEGGKEYVVTQTYKKNLKSLAEFWIGRGMSFRD
jgi:two-component system LytT family response regulator